MMQAMGIMGWTQPAWLVEFWGSPTWRIGMFTVTVLLLVALGKVLRIALLRLGDDLERREDSSLCAVARAAAGSVTFLVFAVGMKGALVLLPLGEAFRPAMLTGSRVLIVVAIVIALYQAVDIVAHWLDRMAAKTDNKLDDLLVPLVRKSLRVTIVLLGLLQVATMLSDKPVTSLLAGLGVGGLAVALAAQETIKNFFGSLVIFADKPFEMGDRITSSDFDGSVESVGFRSTRIRTLDGYLVTIPNGELANKAITNITRRPYFRRIVDLGIAYDTPPAKVDEAVQIVRRLLDNHEGLHSDFPPRVYFNEFNASSINIRAIYWYHPGTDYWAYMAFSEQFNRRVLQAFAEAGIEIAFPTQTLFLAGDPNRPLASPRPMH